MAESGFEVRGEGQAQCRHSLEQLAQMELVMFLVCLQPLHHFLGALVGGPSRNWPSKRPWHHWQVQLYPCVSHAGALDVARALCVEFVLAANLAGALLMLVPVPELCCCPVLLRFVARLASPWGLHHLSKVVGAWGRLLPVGFVASSLPSASWSMAHWFGYCRPGSWAVISGVSDPPSAGVGVCPPPSGFTSMPLGLV